jgi:hypothetical protein
LAQHCGKGGRGELATDGERGLIGSEHGEAFKLAHEVALRLVHVAHGPAGGQAIDLLDEGEVVLRPDADVPESEEQVAKQPQVA